MVLSCYDNRILLQYFGNSCFGELLGWKLSTQSGNTDKVTSDFVFI